MTQVTQVDEAVRLRLKVKLPATATRRSQRCEVELALINDGTQEVRVNTRFGMGYEDMLAREVFVDVVDAVSNAQAPVERSDYERAFAGPSNYAPLAPGESISTSLDLFEWYRPSGAGTYRLTFFYEPVEAHANAPRDAIRGIFRSEPVELVVDD